MDNVFEVKNQKVFMNKSNVFYEDIGVVLDKTTGLVKYGEFSQGLEDWYNVAIKEYSRYNMNNVIEDMFLFRFENYKNILTIEEACTLLNYMFMVSANGNRIFNILQSSTEDLKVEIAKLKELGF